MSHVGFDVVKIEKGAHLLLRGIALTLQSSLTEIYCLCSEFGTRNLENRRRKGHNGKHIPGASSVGRYHSSLDKTLILLKAR